jgi:hypothetical protein
MKKSLRDTKVMPRSDPTRPDFSPYEFSCVRWTPNAELPIPLDRWGNMEVDLLCAEAGLVVELDGGFFCQSRSRVAGTLCFSDTYKSRPRSSIGSSDVTQETSVSLAFSGFLAFL